MEILEAIVLITLQFLHYFQGYKRPFLPTQPYMQKIIEVIFPKQVSIVDFFANQFLVFKFEVQKYNMQNLRIF